MYLKGVPFFNGRCTQISTFPVKNGIQNREGLDRGEEPPQYKTFIGTQPQRSKAGVKHDKNRENFLLFTKPSSQTS